MPVITINIGPENLGELEREFGEGVKHTFFRALRRSQEPVRSFLRMATTGAGIPPSGSKSGRASFSDGWRTEVYWDSSEPAMQIWNAAMHALFVEKGRRRKRRQPPAEAIIPWIQRWLNPDPEKLRSVAFLVARSIGRKGIRARPVLLNKTVQGSLAEIVNRVVNSELDDLTRRAARRG